MKSIRISQCIVTQFIMRSILYHHVAQTLLLGPEAPTLGPPHTHTVKHFLVIVFCFNTPDYQEITKLLNCIDTIGS